MAEFNPDEVDPRKHGVVYLQTIQPHHALVKTNRVLMMLVFALIVVVFIMGIVLLPGKNTLDEIGRTHAITATQNPVLSAEISALKGQMFGLVSGSIEGKIRSLEDNIRRGRITDSLEGLQELKSEVKILSTYSPEPAAKTEQVITDQRVIKELSELKGLVYLTIASCGLMIAAIAGVWLRTRKRLPHQQKPKAYLNSKDS